MRRSGSFVQFRPDANEKVLHILTQRGARPLGGVRAFLSQNSFARSLDLFEMGSALSPDRCRLLRHSCKPD
jgi:hypothetical protein